MPFTFFVKVVHDAKVLKSKLIFVQKSSSLCRQTVDHFAFMKSSPVPITGGEMKLWGAGLLANKPGLFRARNRQKLKVDAFPVSVIMAPEAEAKNCIRGGNVGDDMSFV